MVERFYRTLLLLFQSYVNSYNDWEVHLSHVLYAFQKSGHSTTGVSNLPTSQREKQCAFNPYAYSAKSPSKNKILPTHWQLVTKNYINKYTSPLPSKKKTCVAFYSNSCKLDPRLEGKWVAKLMESPIIVEICDSKWTKVVCAH